MSDYSINMKETCNKIYKKLLDENFHVDMWSDIADTMYDESAVSQLIYQIFSTNFYNSFDESKRLKQQQFQWQNSISILETDIFAIVIEI